MPRNQNKQENNKKTKKNKKKKTKQKQNVELIRKIITEEKTTLPSLRNQVWKKVMTWFLCLIAYEPSWVI